jgi:hypothetical protein
VANLAEIEGYLNRDSYFPGEVMAIQVHTLAARFSFSLQRLGGAGGLLDDVEDLPGERQDYRTDSYANGAGWHTSYRYPLPAALDPGLYAVKLVTDGAAPGRTSYYLPFVVKGRKGPDLPAIVVMSNTFTWQAYNSWGGGSFYKGNPRNPDDSLERILSFDRPNRASCHDSREGHTGCVEQHVCTFLGRFGYRSHWISNRDLHDDPGALDGYRLLIINTHSEYWSAEMFDRLEAFLRAGGSVLNISGNVLWWKVTVRGDRIECRKDGGLHTQTGERGGKWRDLGRPSEPLLGVGSNPKGIHTFAPLQVLDAGHWLFRGTGLGNGDRIGVQGLNEGGASGWETDKVGPLSPASAALLARGLNPDQGGADVVYFETGAGGAVLSAGSISFPGSLVVDPNLQILVRHFLDAWQQPKHPINISTAAPARPPRRAVPTSDFSPGSRGSGYSPPPPSPVPPRARTPGSGGIPPPGWPGP